MSTMTHVAHVEYLRIV